MLLLLLLLLLPLAVTAMCPFSSRQTDSQQRTTRTLSKKFFGPFGALIAF